MRFYQRQGQMGYRARPAWTLHVTRGTTKGSLCGLAAAVGEYGWLPEEQAIGLQGERKVCQTCERLAAALD